MREVAAIAMVAGESAPKVSVIISAGNDRRTIAKVIKQAKLVGPKSEIIVVCSGSKDKTANMARRAGATKVVVSRAPLGHDVGRSVGTKHAGGDVLLFLNADCVIPSRWLKSYVGKVKEGWDVVLNPYSGSSRKRRASMAMHLLNHMLGKPELSGCSMTMVPHAMSRRALQVIGAEKLCVPPVAYATAIVNGLSVTSCRYINTAKMHRKKPGRLKHAVEFIAGDHAEAISYLISRRGARAGMTDCGRCREALRSSDNDAQGGDG